MKFAGIALWVLGPVGSGKSSILARLPAGFQLLDQDVPLEREMSRHGLPLDTRTHDERQAAAFAAIRHQMATLIWNEVVIWRSRRLPIAFQVTGNKPQLLQAEVYADRAAGYVSLGLGLNTPLATCLQRNRARRRILSDEVVESTWHAFDTNLETRIYQQIFGAERFRLTDDAGQVELAYWLDGFASPRPD
jgi:hypothetical protein